MASVKRLDGHHFLIAEDEPLIALDIATALEGEGGTATPANSVSKALTHIGRSQISAAVLGVRLADGDVDPVCQALAVRRVPFIFYTADSSLIPPQWPTAVVLKPARPTTLLGAVQYALEAANDDFLLPLQPASEVHEAGGLEAYIEEAEARVVRARALLERIEATGTDSAAARGFLQTLVQSLENLRYARDARSPRWPFRRL
jgi:DNA-binding response OmpR family regulator